MIVRGFRAGTFLVLGCCLMLGCGEKVTPPVIGQLSGKVTFNGTAVAGGIINFENDTGAAASAEIGDDGAYKVETGEGGLRVGNYKVFISPAAAEIPTDMTTKTATKTRTTAPGNIPIRYQTASTSGLTVVVKEGKNDPFDVDMKK